MDRFRNRYQENQRGLLKSVKKHMPELEDWAAIYLASMWGYEDGMYRFYHHSDKVVALRHAVQKGVRTFRKIRRRRLNRDYEAIVRAGTAARAGRSDIVAAFLHTKYFVEMMIKYGRELDDEPSPLPSGWASVLYLYRMR